MIMKTVEVLLAVYDPDESFLKKQLMSLDAQTYGDMSILIYDDCPGHRCDPGVFRDCLKNKSWQLLPYGGEALGSTGAFETLLAASAGDYIAFCDQDDIWDAEKIAECVRTLEEDGTDLVVADRRLIDEYDIVTCPSVRASSTAVQDSWKTGDDVGRTNFFACCGIGMNMAARGDFARSTLPIPGYTGHDKWLFACACAGRGTSFIEKPLASYRRHSNNVSGTLKGIDCKEDYIRLRAKPHLQLAEEFAERYPDYAGNADALAFGRARVEGDVRTLWRLRGIAPQIAKFDMLMAMMPDGVFRRFAKAVKKRAHD